MNGYCAANKQCATPSCADQAQNAAETDVDCGGADCPKCAVGHKCKAGTDCEHGVCAADGTCAPRSCPGTTILWEGHATPILFGETSPTGDQNVEFAPGTFCLTSGDTGVYAMVFQSVGDLVLYHDDQPIWNAGTANQGATLLAFQTDGNVVIYAADEALWSSDTHARRNNDNQFIVQTDGTAVIYGNASSNPRALWSSDTAGE
jgi:hypothetical protein